MNECPLCEKKWSFKQKFGSPTCPRTDYKCEHCKIWIAIYNSPFYVMILRSELVTVEELKLAIQRYCTPVKIQLELFQKGVNN